MNNLTKQQRQELFFMYMNLVYSIYHKKYSFLGEDGIQMGMEGLWQACLHWNPDKSNNKFTSYAYLYIDGFIKNGLNGCSSSVEMAIKKEISNNSGNISECELWDKISQSFKIEKGAYHALYSSILGDVANIDEVEISNNNIPMEVCIEEKDVIQRITLFVKELKIPESQKNIYLNYMYNVLTDGFANISGIASKFQVTKQWVSFVISKINKIIRKNFIIYDAI